MLLNIQWKILVEFDAMRRATMRELLWNVFGKKSFLDCIIVISNILVAFFNNLFVPRFDCLMPQKLTLCSEVNSRYMWHLPPNYIPIPTMTGMQSVHNEKYLVLHEIQQITAAYDSEALQVQEPLLLSKTLI